MSLTPETSRDRWTDAQFILAHGKEAQIRESPIFLGRLQRPGWTGRIPTYLVWCRRCRIRPNRGFTVTHEAGYERRIACGTCGARYERLLPSRKLKDMGLNPHHHPWLVAFLSLLAILLALVSR